MTKLCEVCKAREYTKLCDHATGTGVITSINFQEITETCDKKLCNHCAINLWNGCDLCPEHAVFVTAKLNRHLKL